MAEMDDYKKQYGKWEKQYASEGLSIFSPQNIGILKAIQARYSGPYAEFFYSLSSQFSGSDIEKDLVDAAQSAKSVAAHIGVLLGSRGRKATASEIDMLFDMMARVATRVEYYKAQIAKNDKIANAAGKAEKSTGVSIDELQYMTKQTEKQVAKMAPPKESAASYFKRVSPEMYETGQDIVGGIANAALGPFAGMAKAAMGGISGIAKDFYAKKVAKQQRKFITGLNPMAMGMDVDSLMGVGGARSKGANVGKYTSRGSMASMFGLGKSAPGGPARGEAAGTSQKRAPAQTVQVMAAPSGSSGSIHPDMISDGLFTFFDKPAYKAKWTKDIHKFLEKISKVGKGLGFMDLLTAGLLGGIAGAVLGVLGAIVAGILIILAGIGLGALLYKLFPDFFNKINEGIEGFFTKMFIGWDKFTGWLHDVFGGFASSLEGLLLAGPMGFFGNMWQAVSGRMDAIMEGLKQSVISSVIGFFGTVVAELGGKVHGWLDKLGIIDSFWGGISGLGVKIGETIAKLTEDFDWLGKAMSGMVSVGAKVMDVIWEKLAGIQGLLGAFSVGGMSGVGKKVGEAIQSMTPSATLGGSVGTGFDMLKNLFGGREDTLAQTIAGDTDEPALRTVNVGKESTQLPTIPIVLAGGGGLVESIQELMNMVSKDLKTIVADSKAIPKNVPVGRDPDIDVYGTRDTYTEAMNMGLVGVED